MKNGDNNNDCNDIIAFIPIKVGNLNKEKQKNNPELLYYDNHSGKTAHISKESIKIYNKNGTNLFIDLNIMLPIEKIKMISHEKNLEYTLVYLESKTMNKSILVVNLRKGKVISILQDDYRKFLGVLFLNTNLQYEINQQFIFCIIFQDLIVVKMINRDTEEIFNIKLVKYPNSSIKIDEYLYNKTYKILCCIRSDNTFDFYNLSNETHLLKGFNWSTFKRKKNNHWSDEKYEGMQFFLQIIYNQLYFIIFDIEKRTIHLFQITNLVNIENQIELKLEMAIKCGTLVFVDNLIVVINHANWGMVVIDLLSHYESKIISSFAYSNPYDIDIEELYYKGGSIAQYKDTLYDVSFNLLAYSYSFPYRIRHEALLSFLRRKNAKEFIYKSLNEMVQRRVKITRIFVILNEIVMEILKGLKPLYDNLDLNEQKKANELIIPIEYLLKRRKRIMKQYDGFCLFKSLDINPHSEMDIMRYIMIFTFLLNSYGIKPQPSFNQLILTIIQKIKIEGFIEIFDLFPFFDHEDTAKYLLKYSQKLNNNKFKLAIRQIAFDSLIRLKKHNYIFKHLLSEGLFDEAFIFYSNHSFKVTSESILSAISNKLTIDQKKMLFQYITDRNHEN